VKNEGLDWLADNPLYTKRFAYFVGRRCRETTVQEVADELHLDWHAVKELEKQYMREQLRRAGAPSPRVIGIDEISVGKGHQYRIVVSDLVRGRAIWFGGCDRSEESMDEFYRWLGPTKSGKIRLAVMDMWKAFRTSTLKPGNAPQAAILYDKFHILKHLGEAMDKVRKQEYAQYTGGGRRFIKGQKYALLSHWGNLTTDGKAALRLLFHVNARLNKAYLLKESFWAIVGLQESGVGAEILQPVVLLATLATVEAVPEIRAVGRIPLGRDRGVLPRGEQGAAGIRRRVQQQDPRDPAAGLRLPRRGVPTAQDSDVYAAETVKNHPLKNPMNLAINYAADKHHRIGTLTA
jgi:hypothetical protein